MRNSGKLLILGIVALAVLLAAASWWFRYRSTHRAAEFWGPHAVRLVRDAPVVTLQDLNSDMAPTEVDISKAHGLIHLRYALMEDRSYDWPDPKTSLRPSVSSPRWLMKFSDSSTGEEVAIQFAEDCRLAELKGDHQQGRAISCAPIAAGLSQVFAEYVHGAVAPAR